VNLDTRPESDLLATECVSSVDVNDFDLNILQRRTMIVDTRAESDPLTVSPRLSTVVEMEYDISMFSVSQYHRLDSTIFTLHL
jgi:hypothetical protein